MSTSLIGDPKRLQNLEDAANRRVEFPTEEEWGRALAAIGDATTAVMNVVWKLERIAEFRGARTPTFEDIGLIHAHSIDMEGSLDELSRWVRGTKTKTLGNLDYVRVLNNIPDDQDDDA